MGLLTELSNILKKIAIYNYAVIIVVNMITRSFNLDVQEGSKSMYNCHYLDLKPITFYLK